MTKSVFEKQIEALYSDVLLHIAYMLDDDGNHIIYALFECYPNELKVIDTLTEQTFKTDGVEFHYVRIKMSINEAVVAYRACVDKGQLDINTKNGGDIIIQTIDMVDYKIWPHFLCAEKNGSEGIPFIPNTWGVCRIHQMFPKVQEEKIIKLISKNQSLSDWMKSFWTWDISDFPELVGGACFLLPNPYYRHRNIHMLQGENNDPDVVKIEFQARKDIDLSLLTIYPIEKTHFGYAVGAVSETKDSVDSMKSLDTFESVKQFTVQECIIVPLIGKAEDFSFIILDENNELIDRTSPAGFWKGFSIAFSVGGLKKSITRPKSGKKDEIEMLEHFGTIDERVEDGVLQKRFDYAKIRRVKKEEKIKSGVHIFQNDHGGAERFLRRKIQEARKSVMIVDPYISAEELFAYAMATGNRNARVTILTSNEKLKKEFTLAGNNQDPYEEQQKVKEIDAMKDGLKQYEEKTGGEIKLYVMKNKPYPVHDRFIIVDDVVWFCGSSLHPIGDRMSCIVRLQSKDEILEYIDGLIYSEEVEEINATDRNEAD